MTTPVAAPVKPGALADAVRRSAVSEAEDLLRRGADINDEGFIKRDLMKYAIANKCAEIVRLFVAYKADVNKRDRNGRTPLSDAASAGSLEMVTSLLEGGADVSVIGYGLKMSVLMHAVIGGNADVVRLVLSKGADLHVMDTYQRTAMSFAANKPEIAKILLEALALERETQESHAVSSRSQLSLVANARGYTIRRRSQP